jgi:hypothetical protein
MDLLNTILDQVMDSNNLQQLAAKADVEEGIAKKAIKAGLPAILEGLNQNSNTKKGAESLNEALSQHDGGVFSDFENGKFDNLDIADGGKIIGHIFGSNQNAVTKELGKEAGISSNKTMKLLSLLAPIIMGFLGKQKKENDMNASDISGLTTSLMSNFLGGSGGGGDLLGMVTGLLGSQSGDSDKPGLGGILDDLF